MRTRGLFAVCAALALVSPRASAQSADALTKAQASFDQAQVDYLQGKYDEAAQGFQQAYAARPFPQFLYNIAASFHMKGKKTSDVEAYKKAVEFYKRYLQEDTTASDRPKVEKAIAVLDDEIKRLSAPPRTEAAARDKPAAPAPSNEVQQLGDVKVHGLVVIVTEPQNATIYLDDKKKGPFGQTPWSGSLDGQHKIIIEKRGYRPVESTISADPSKLVQVISSLAQESYLGWIDVTSNVPGADVYIDDKSVGAIGKTPMSQNIKPGKHTFWITAEGYDEYTQTVDIAAGEPHAIKGKLKGSPLGQLSIVGNVDDAAILLDGKVLCEHGPCIRRVPEGEHKLVVTQPDHKPLAKSVTVQRKTDTTVKVALAPQPGRSDAVVAYVFTGIFVAGGVYAGMQAQHLHDDLQTAIARGSPPVDSNDPRFLRGKVYAIGADACYGIAAIAGLTAIYYTFRDKGSPSTGTTDIHAVSLHPAVSPSYAGLGMEVRW
jgi:hypothetical protein